MAYATIGDLFARFGEDEINQVADTDGTGSPDAVVVNRALGDADAEIDAALVGRYKLPITPTPELLTRIACDLARESLYADSPTKNVADRAKASRDLLAAIAVGKMRFDTAVVEAAAPAQSDARIQTGRRRMSWPE